MGLKDLFELAFEITKVNGQPIMHTDIDGAASNGTTMTIKALTNMYLLLHLMDREQAGRVRLPTTWTRRRTSTSATRPRCWRPACNWASCRSWRA